MADVLATVCTLADYSYKITMRMKQFSQDVKDHDENAQETAYQIQTLATKIEIICRAGLKLQSLPDLQGEFDAILCQIINHATYGRSIIDRMVESVSGIATPGLSTGTKIVEHMKFEFREKSQVEKDKKDLQKVMDDMDSMMGAATLTVAINQAVGQYAHLPAQRNVSNGTAISEPVAQWNVYGDQSLNHFRANGQGIRPSMPRANTGSSFMSRSSISASSDVSSIFSLGRRDTSSSMASSATSYFSDSDIIHEGDPLLSPELITAIKNKDLVSVKVQLKAGTQILEKDREGRCALHHAARAGGGRIMAALIGSEQIKGKEGAIDFKDNTGATALHHAAEAGQRELAIALITAGADQNASDSLGHSPLYRAVKGNHEKIVEMLLERGAKTPTNFGAHKARFKEMKTSIDARKYQREKAAKKAG